MNSSVETYGGQGGSVVHQVNQSELPLTGIPLENILFYAILIIVIGLTIYLIDRGIKEHK